MRVISGKRKGLHLKSPQGEDTRPTLDRVKEALFSMLLPKLSDASVLDLFAGSGALGIEALSRNSARTVFVDKSAEAIECIKKNVAAAQFEAHSEILCCSAETFFRKCTERFDIIFLDPPYAGNMYRDTILEISRKNILNSDGWIVAEWDKAVGRPDFPEEYITFKDKNYGRVCITILKKEA